MSLELKYGFYLLDKSKGRTLEALLERFPYWRNFLLSEYSDEQSDAVALWDCGDEPNWEAVGAAVRESNVEKVISTKPWDELSLRDLFQNRQLVRKMVWLPPEDMVEESVPQNGPSLVILYDAESLPENSSSKKLVEWARAFRDLGDFPIEVVEYTSAGFTVPKAAVCLSLLENSKNESWVRARSGLLGSDRFKSLSYEGGAIRSLFDVGSTEGSSLAGERGKGGLGSMKAFGALCADLVKLASRKGESSSRLYDLESFSWGELVLEFVERAESSELDSDQRYLLGIIEDLDSRGLMRERFSVIALFLFLSDSGKSFVFRDWVKANLISLIRERLCDVLHLYPYGHKWSYLFLKLRSMYPDWDTVYEKSVLEEYETTCEKSQGLFCKAALSLVNLHRCARSMEARDLLEVSDSWYRFDREREQVAWSLYSALAVVHHFKDQRDELPALRSLLSENIPVFQNFYSQIAIQCSGIGQIEESASLFKRDWNASALADVWGHYYIRVLIVAGDLKSAESVFETLRDQDVLNQDAVDFFEGLLEVDFRNPNVAAEKLERLRIVLAGSDTHRFPVFKLKLLKLLGISSGRISSKALLDTGASGAGINEFILQCYQSGLPEDLYQWNLPEVEVAHSSIEDLLLSLASWAIRRESDSLNEALDTLENSQEKFVVRDVDVAQRLIISVLNWAGLRGAAAYGELSSIVILHWELRIHLLEESRDELELLCTERTQGLLLRLAEHVLEVARAKGLFNFRERVCNC